jgi:predicted RND superfamily exporter protein
MTCLDIGLDVNTLPVLAIGTGVGIDYAIYLASRVREEFSRFNDYQGALAAAVETTGRAIFLTGSALVAGMIPWYLLSSLRFQANMGLLIGFLMITNMVAALIIVPLLVSLCKPKFIARDAVSCER